MLPRSGPGLERTSRRDACSYMRQICSGKSESAVTLSPAIPQRPSKSELIRLNAEDSGPTS